MRAGRWALGLGLTWALGGCIFLTPPTGLSFGSAAQTFPSQAPAGVQVKVYEAADLKIGFPADWEGGVPTDPGSDASTTRLIARLATEAGLLSLTVTEVTSAAAADQAALTALVSASLQGTYEPLTASSPEPAPLGEGAGSVSAQRIAYEGTPKAPGAAPSWGLAYAVRVHDRNYVFVYAGPVAQAAELKPFFENLAKLVEFPAPTEGASPTPAPEGSASPAPEASSSPAS